MKTAKQWVNENSQSGPFDTVGSCKDAESLVKEIQTDAQSNAYKVGWWEVSNFGEALQCWDALSNTKEPESFSFMTDHRHIALDVCWALFEKLKAGLPEADRARCE